MEKMSITINKKDLKKKRIISKNKPAIIPNKKLYKRKKDKKELKDYDEIDQYN